MKYLSIALLVLFGLELLGCTGNTCNYSTWNIKDGWSNSVGQINESLNISFEYPGCFYKLTKTDLNKFREHFAPHGDDITEANYHYVDLYRHIKGNNNLFVSSDSDYTHRMSFALDISTPMIDMLNAWDETIQGDETFFEWWISEFFSRDCDIQYEKQILIDGLPAYSVKFHFTGGYHDEPYQNRVFIITLLKFNDAVIDFQMDAWEGEADEVEGYYNHLLETFEINS